MVCPDDSMSVNIAQGAQGEARELEFSRVTLTRQEVTKARAHLGA
jgi:hypothetical protein